MQDSLGDVLDLTFRGYIGECFKVRLVGFV
jgi:hypothetical protein